MKNQAAAFVVLSAALFTPQVGSAASYSVDKSHTSVVFSISHLGYSFTYGMFKEFGGSFEFDKENPSGAKFDFTIDAASLDTNDAKRDEHLRGPDFFNARQFPRITFQSESVQVETDDQGRTVYQATGPLTMHGVTREVTLPITFLGEGNGPYGNYRAGFVCQTSIDRTEFGMNFMAGPIGKDVAIVFSFEGLRQ